MQKISTRIFIISSIAFGVFGILLVFIPPDDSSYGVNIYFTIAQKALLTSLFVLLPSFAIAVASRFLNSKK